LDSIYNKTQYKEKRRDLRRHQTDAERVLWGRIRDKRFLGLKFFRQYGVGFYIVDFYCPAYRLAIELDGGQHAEAESQEYDAIRTDYLKSINIKVIRFWNHDVLLNVEGVLEEMRRGITPLAPLILRGGLAENDPTRGKDQ